MKKVVVLSLGFFVLTACNKAKNDSSENTEEQITTEELIGGEKDKHGCLTAAGETWSELQQGCIQVFEVGQRLNPIEVAEGEAVISAFVLFNDDRSKLELFLPTKNETIILDKNEEESYQNDTFRFDTKDLTLYIDDKQMYKAE